MSLSMLSDWGIGGRWLVAALVVLATASMAPADDAKKPTDEFKIGNQTIGLERFEPKEKGKVPAVIIVHGASGMDEHADAYRTFARELADAGYAAFIVHYFDRTQTKKNPDDKLIRIQFQNWMQTLKDTVSYVAKQPNVDDKRIGFLGFSLGAFLSLSTAGQDPRIVAVVEYFGGLPKPLLGFIKKMPPTLILHGESDKAVNVEEAHKLEKFYTDKGFPYEIKLYPNQGHGFTGDDAKDATKRAIAFFDKNLKQAASK
jgi:carboxymethylenebutenolidase